MREGGEGCGVAQDEVTLEPSHTDDARHEELNADAQRATEKRGFEKNWLQKNSDHDGT